MNNGASATPVGGAFDNSKITLKNITSSSDLTNDDQLVDTVVSFPSAPRNVCAF
jgi:hypothetical protein